MKKQIKEKNKKADAKGKITKEMTFNEVIKKNPEAIEILLKKGMHCIGCPMAQMESLEQGALAHGLNPDKLVKELNKAGGKI